MLFYVVLGALLFIITIYLIRKPKKKKKITRINHEQNTRIEMPITTYNSEESKDDDSSKWEIVYRNTERWNELGFSLKFGDGRLFPGYGRLYDGEFEVWCCDVGSKEKNNVQIFQDRYSLFKGPNFHSMVGDYIDFEQLINAKGYEALYSGLDKKNRKRWYFALLRKSPSFIETRRALDVEEKKTIEEINVPEGWELVRRNSIKWKELGFGDGEFFPGYGKLYERHFDVWYCNIGEKEKIVQPDFKDRAILNLFNGICGDLRELKDKGLSFESLINKQGYKELLTTVDKKERKRWYFGLKETKPLYIYTAR